MKESFSNSAILVIYLQSNSRISFIRYNLYHTMNWFMNIHLYKKGYECLIVFSSVSNDQNIVTTACKMILFFAKKDRFVIEYKR